MLAATVNYPSDGSLPLICSVAAVLHCLIVTCIMITIAGYYAYCLLNNALYDRFQERNPGVKSTGSRMDCNILNKIFIALGLENLEDRLLCQVLLLTAIIIFFSFSTSQLDRIDGK
jgi:multisubunit Na+/H+ antiporter MnhC subunit